MRFGFVIPGGTPAEVVSLAVEAEAAGWDGVFYWDGTQFDPPQPIYDAWLVLTAIAMRTERVRLGAVVFALARRRPWEVAREAATLDHISGGRLILPVGLGAPDAHHFGRFGLPEDRRTRAELLDESLEVITALWTGAPVSHDGKHYKLENVTFQPPPLQQPRPPIWVIGLWPNERSMARALRYDGLLVNKAGGPGGGEPSDFKEIAAYVAERRTAATPFDLIAEGTTPNDPAGARAAVEPWAAAGATWWVESPWTAPNPGAVRKRVLAGPPRLAG